MNIKQGEQLLLSTFSISLIFKKLYLVKMCPIFAGSPSTSLFRPSRLSVCPSVRLSVCPSQKFFFAKSTNVTNRCCHICFSDDKNVCGNITWPPGALGGAQKGPGGSHQKLVKWKKFINKLCCLCFIDDKNAFGVPPPAQPRLVF